MTKLYFTQDNQIVNVHLQSDVSVNAWSGSAVLPESMRIGNIITADSVTEIWQTLPQLEDGRIIFTGGTPNGFEGDGILFQFIAGRGSYVLDFSPDTVAYLNDGLGTEAETILQEFNYELALETAIRPQIDNKPPQSFKPVMYKDKSFFDGEPVVIFSARDLESGISYYEVREITEQGAGDWQMAESPYLINPDVQTIEIKAVDSFGNERIEILDIKPEFLVLKLIIVAVIAVVIVLSLYTVIVIKRHKKRQIHEL